MSDTSAYLTHLSETRDPFASDAICGFAAADGETFGITSQDDLVTCPDCIVRIG